VSAGDDGLLRIDSVTARFGGVTAVDRVSFSVRPGELLALIGPNGAGKTTLLRLVTGLVPARTGAVRLDDRDITRLRPAARARLGLGLSHQIVRPFRNMTVLDNVTVAAGYARTGSPLRALVSVSRSAARARARELLAVVGIEGAAESDPSTQPLGVLKRMEVARALAIEPRVLLLDEPLAGLGQAEAARLSDTLVALNRRGITIVLIEHNLAEVLRICPRLVVLDNGRLIADGEATAVMADPDVIAAYVGEGSGRAPS
jgi:branched-chain amino acid transport system ATP-binding protein